MKAIQVLRPRETILAEVEKPGIEKDTDVLVRVMAVGICGSDLHIAHGTNPYATYPRIIGHEVSGQVEEVGSAVKQFRPGDRVVLEPVQSCGSCYACRKGRYNVCRNMKVSGVHTDGGCREYMVVNCGMLHRFPEEIPFIQATAVEPYTVGEQAHWRAGTSAGDMVLVQGAGPVGLIVCDIAKRLGAVCIVSEINETRLARAKDFGADYLIRPQTENFKERIMEITEGMGPNIIFEATGVSALLSEAAEIVSAAGVIVPMSYGSVPVPINFQRVNQKEIGILGTRLQCSKFDGVIRNFPRYLDRVNKLITHVFPAEEYRKAFELFDDKDSGACKIVLTFSE